MPINYTVLKRERGTQYMNNKRLNRAVMGLLWGDEGKAR